MKKHRYIFFSAGDDGGAASSTETVANTGQDAAAAGGETKTGDAAGDTQNGGTAADNASNDTGKKYSEEDITKLKADFNRQIQEATVKAVDDALKLAKMKPEEKAEYEQAQKLVELEKREQEAALKELRLDTLEVLASKQLPKEFVDYVLANDKETTLKRIDAFKPLFDQAVQKQVEIRLAGKTPNGGNSSTKTESQSIEDEFNKAMRRFC